MLAALGVTDDRISVLPNQDRRVGRCR